MISTTSDDCLRWRSKEHGLNMTHDTNKCKVLNGDPKPDWKKNNASNDKYKDYQAKYKEKKRELNILQSEMKKEKVKWSKAYKKLKDTGDSTSQSGSS
jgi:hypothetical protein